MAAAPAGGQVGHLSQLHPNALLTEARDVLPDASRAEPNEFLLKDLTVPAGEVSGVYMVPDTQLLRVNLRSFEPFADLRSFEPFAAALSKLGRESCGLLLVDVCVWMVLCRLHH